MNLIRITFALSLVLILSACARDTSFVQARSHPALDYNGSSIQELIAFEPQPRRFSLAEDDMDSWRRPRPQPSVIDDQLNLGDAGFSAPNLVSLLRQDSSEVWTLVLADKNFDRSERLLDAIAATGAELQSYDTTAGFISITRDQQTLRLSLEKRSSFWYLRLPDLEASPARSYLEELQSNYMSSS